MKTVLALIAILLSGSAIASQKEVNDFDVTFTGWTHHLTSTDRNQDNYINGFRYKQFDAFTLINSFENRSYGISWYPQWVFNDYINYGVRIGGLTGYTKEENAVQIGGVTPLIAPAVIFHYKNLGAEVGMFTDVMVFSLKVMV